MLDFRFLFLLRMLRMLLISFTVTCGHLLYSACLAIDIIWSLLMISLITYLLNRLPSTASPALTPHHALFGTPPSYDHLCVFGCACYPNISVTAPHKLAPRSTRCVFLGYSPDHKGYRCFDLSSRRVLISRHVVFDESDFPYSTSSTPSSDPELESLLSPSPMV